MPHNTLWTLRESKRYGLTSELISAFRNRAAADGIDTVDALVRVMRQYIESPQQRQDSGTVPQPPHEF